MIRHSRRAAPRRHPRRFTLERLESRDLPAPVVMDPNLAVRTVVSELNLPTGMAFLGANDFFVLEKNSGQVKRVVDGVVRGTVLDLAVNSGSERGLLGIALHPNFHDNDPGTPRYVYLYWTRGLHLTALLYLVFIGLCVMGLVEWRRSLAAPAPATA